ncbi:MAG: hypothetical protein KJO06_06615 [Gemmatimonadetes bacterium]|nr:hypothetical protein [Gemmatimonadota bacterium]
MVPHPIPAEMVVELESGERVECGGAQWVGDTLVTNSNRTHMDQIAAVEYRVFSEEKVFSLVATGVVILVIAIAPPIF